MITTDLILLDVIGLDKCGILTAQLMSCSTLQKKKKTLQQFVFLPPIIYNNWQQKSTWLKLKGHKLAMANLKMWNNVRKKKEGSKIQFVPK